MIRGRDQSPGGADPASADAAAQLPLRLALSRARRFGNFEATQENAELVDAVRRIAADHTPERVLIVGDAGSGKSHLLEAASEAARSSGDAVAFAPMRDWSSQHVDAVRGLGQGGLVCIDDIDAVAGDRGWEEALLALVEESASRQTRMLVSAGAAPSNIRFVLADLRSRLSAATLYRLRELDDEGRGEGAAPACERTRNRHSGRRRGLRAHSPPAGHAEPHRAARPARLSLDGEPASAHRSIRAGSYQDGLRICRLRCRQSDLAPDSFAGARRCASFASRCPSATQSRSSSSSSGRALSEPATCDAP